MAPPRAIVGLGAGTVSKQITAAYGLFDIDGVEIDPAIVDLGRSYFAMDEANLHVYVTDGRAFLAAAAEPYDWVIVDAYQGSDIPFHLVTTEFFRQLRDRMGPQAVLSINVAWWKPDDPVLLGRLVATVQAVFPKVFTVTRISRQSGAVLLAGGGDLSISNLLRAAQAVGHPGVTEIAREVLGGNGPHLSPATAMGQPLTDDRAPIEAIADRMYRQNRRESFQREQSVLKP